jgi:hypothetical protein
MPWDVVRGGQRRWVESARLRNQNLRVCTYVFVNGAFRHSLLKYTCMHILSFKSNLILINKYLLTKS